MNLLLSKFKDIKLPQAPASLPQHKKYLCHCAETANLRTTNIINVQNEYFWSQD